MKTIIVTRHPAFLTLLRERHPELAPEGAVVVAHVEDPAQVDGAHVVGDLPLHLAARASRVTKVTLELTAQDRGVELGIERLREVAGAPRTFVVRELPAASAAVTWSDQIGSRGRKAHLWLVTPAGAVHVFTGESIAGVAAVVGREFEKKGKWSHTTFRLELGAGVRAVPFLDGWERGTLAEGLRKALRLEDERPETIATALGVARAALIAAVAAAGGERTLEEWAQARLDAAELTTPPPAPPPAPALEGPLAAKLRAAGLLD
jgi:hypothetical protein